MQAEQELLQGGTPLETVQKLCDVHAALFRGATSEEKVANAEKAVAASVKEKKLAATAALTGITGHPLQTFTRENEVLENVIRKCRNEIEETNTLSPELFGKLREVAIHYAKKGDLLYPHLKVKYGISGPSDVMWTTDVRSGMNWQRWQSSCRFKRRKITGWNVFALCCSAWRI